MAKVKITSRFRDKIDHKTWYEVGMEVEFSDEERVKDLISKGWVEVVRESPKESVSVFCKEFDRAVIMDAMKSIDEPVHHAIGVTKLEDKIAELSDEKKVALKAALGIAEQAKENVELEDGQFIEIVLNGDGTRTAYGEDNGEKAHLASGEYRSSTHVYVVGDAGNVDEEKELKEE